MNTQKKRVREIVARRLAARGSEAAMVSVVVPFKNAQDRVQHTLTELLLVLDKTSTDVEVVAVDNGSSDETLGLLAAAATDDDRIRVMSFEENLGEGAALYWGLQVCSGDVLVTMDGLGSTDPGAIPRLLALLNRADLVVGRVDERDSLFERFAYAKRTRSFRPRVQNGCCTLKAFRAEVLPSFLPLQAFARSMPALAAMAGYRVEITCVGAGTGPLARPAGPRASALGRSVDTAGLWWLANRTFKRTFNGHQSINELSPAPWPDGLTPAPLVASSAPGVATR